MPLLANSRQRPLDQRKRQIAELEQFRDAFARTSPSGEESMDYPWPDHEARADWLLPAGDDYEAHAKWLLPADDDYEDERGSVFRGLLFGVPLSLLLWAAII